MSVAKHPKDGKKRGYARADRIVVMDRRLTLATRGFYAYLKAVSFDDEVSRGRRQMAEENDISADSVDRHIAALRAIGALRVSRRGKKLANVITLISPSDSATAPSHEGSGDSAATPTHSSESDSARMRQCVGTDAESCMGTGADSLYNSPDLIAFSQQHVDVADRFKKLKIDAGPFSAFVVEQPQRVDLWLQHAEQKCKCHRGVKSWGGFMLSQLRAGVDPGNIVSSRPVTLPEWLEDQITGKYRDPRDATL